MRLYRALYAWNSSALAQRKLAEVLQLPIVFPASLTSVSSGAGQPAPTLPALATVPTTAAVAAQPPLAIANVQRTLSELAALHRSDFLTTPSDSDAAVIPPMVLNATGAALLSQDAKDLLRSLSITLTALPIYALVTGLEATVGIRGVTTGPADPTLPVTPHTPGLVGDSGVFPHLQASGIADLLVLKQHLTGYLRTDISHIENIMAGRDPGVPPSATSSGPSRPSRPRSRTQPKSRTS